MNLYYLDISCKFTSFKVTYEDADFNFLFTRHIRWNRIVIECSFKPCGVFTAMHKNERHLLGPGLFAGVGLTSLAALILQVCLTRLFSVALWHHFAFMVVSIAFLGFGASGTFLMMVPKMRTLPLRPTLACLALSFSLATLAAYVSSNVIPFDPARIMWDRYQGVYLLAYYVVLAIPFFFAGMILALVYTEEAKAVDRLYAWDLGGAGLGCMVVFLTYTLAGEAGTVFSVCLLSGLASFAFRPGGWKLNLVRGPWMVIACALLMTRPGFLDLNISPYKALKVVLRYPEAHTLETRWDPATRLDVIESKAIRFAPGLSLEFQGRIPQQLGLCVDAGHLNAVTRFTGDMDDIAFTASLPSSFPYVISRASHVLIVEPLGGLDVLVARHNGAGKVVTTHANPLVLGVMENSLNEFSGNLYEDRTATVKDQARSFLLRTRDRFDVIQLPLTDTLGATASGLYGLSEDYTLTVEAFKTYIRALTPDGVLSVTKYLLPPPRHELRLVALGCGALEALGVEHPSQHIAAARRWGPFTLLVNRRPFEPQEIDRMKGFCSQRRFDLVYYPGMPDEEANQYNRFPAPLYHQMTQKILDPAARQAFYDAYLFDVRPVTDDRPFFYHNFRIDKIVPLYRAVGDKWQLFLEGGYLVHLVFFQAVAICILLIALPLKKAGRPASSWFLAYFALIGMAFMLTEICLIQRFILFLARPVYAFSAVLFSILVTSALGSYCSRKVRFPKDNGEIPGKKSLSTVPLLAATPILLFLYALLLQSALTAAIVWPLWTRLGVAFLAILPLGFMMGMFFPMGVRVLSRRFAHDIPWAWAVNASVSVVGSVLAVLIALSAGFTAVLCVAAAAYGLAVVVLWRMMRGGKQNSGVMEYWSDGVLEKDRKSINTCS